MNVSGIQSPLLEGRARQRALAPVVPVRGAADPTGENAPRSRRRDVPVDRARMERVREALHVGAGPEPFLGNRARYAAAAYGAIHSLPDREYVRAVMGVDEFA